MVRASLIGAILANLLLALGLSFLLGGLRYRDQKYNPLAARAYSTMMLIAVISLLVPTSQPVFALGKHHPAGAIAERRHRRGVADDLRLVSGVCAQDASRLFASVDTESEVHDHGKQWSVAQAVGGLIGASVLAAWMSEILVGAAEGTGKSLGMSQTFIGIVFLAIVGGAAESGSAIAMARKNKVDLSLGIALGSSIQIALFVAPGARVGKLLHRASTARTLFQPGRDRLVVHGSVDRDDGLRRRPKQLVQRRSANHGLHDHRAHVLLHTRTVLAA